MISVSDTICRLRSVVRPVIAETSDKSMYSQGRIRPFMSTGYREVVPGITAIGLPVFDAETTWNPTIGSERVSSGCDHCYALTPAKRLKARNHLMRLREVGVFGRSSR